MKAPPRVLIGSSPGRAEKLPPPPFSRLLKGKGGSRSRGRSTHLSSPMFSMKRRQPMEEKEPGSPTVTCIGQVRIGKKHRGDHKDGNNTQKTKKKHKKKNKKKEKKKQLLGWDHCHMHKSLLCNPFSRGESIFEWQKWRKWLTCYPNRDQRQLLEEEGVDPPKPLQALQVDLTEEVELEKGKQFEPVAPPKNALLLMRCRSAPQRGSPLTSRFWVAEEEPNEADPHGEGAKRGQVEAAEEEEEEISRGAEEVTDGGRSHSCSLPSRPLILTRCKSEPARRWGGSKQNGCGRYYSPSKSRRLLALADEAFPRPLPLR